MAQRRIPTLGDTGRLDDKFLPVRLSDTSIVQRIQQIAGSSGTGSSSGSTGSGSTASDGLVATYILTSGSQTRSALAALVPTLVSSTGAGTNNADGVIIGTDEFVYIDDTKIFASTSDGDLLLIDPDLPNDPFTQNTADSNLIDVVDTDVAGSGSTGTSTGTGTGYANYDILYDTDGTPYFSTSSASSSSGGAVDAESVRDIIGAALVGGANVSIGVNDYADTITISIDNALFITSGERAKLASIVAYATANASDAQLRDRSTHTGSQPISSITGLQAALTTVPVLTLTSSQVIPAGYSGYTIEVNSSTATTLTFAPDSSMPYDVGSVVTFTQVGGGTLSFGAQTGVTLNSADTLTVRRQWSTVTARKRAANTWLVEGDLA